MRKQCTGGTSKHFISIFRFQIPDLLYFVPSICHDVASFCTHIIVFLFYACTIRDCCCSWIWGKMYVWFLKPFNFLRFMKTLYFGYMHTDLNLCLFYQEYSMPWNFFWVDHFTSFGFYWLKFSFQSFSYSLFFIFISTQVLGFAATLITNFCLLFDWI
jgi:hypothetical protein